MANTPVDNMGARRYRRIVARLGIAYETSPECIEKFIDGIKKILMKHPRTRKDYYHVIFDEYADSSLIIMLYFFLEVPSWSQELLEKQQIFLAVHRLASELGIRFAYPTQSIYIENPASMEGGVAPEAEGLLGLRAPKGAKTVR